MMQTETPSPPSKPRLRWYQYRLRTLLILMTLLAVWMSWFSHRARQQKVAVEKIRALGGSVLYDYRIKGANWDDIDPTALPPYPKWLRDWVGEDYFETVGWVILDNRPVTDNDLAILENLPDIKTLVLAETKITSSGLVHLEGLKNLKCLFLHQTVVDDSGLVHLKYLKKLQLLMIQHTQVTEKGIKGLQSDLPNTKIIYRGI